MPTDSDFKYLQKVNAKCPQISGEKKIKNDFSRSKIIHQKDKLFFSIRNLRAFTFYRYFQSDSEGKLPQILRAITVYYF